MNSKRQISAINNRDWTSKTQKENAKYVRSKLEMLGYKVPKYMKKGQINQQQLEFYTNRIMNRLTKIVDKEERAKQRRRRKPISGESNQHKLKRLVGELNSRLDVIHKYIDDNYSGQVAQYLKGNMAQLGTRDKAFIRDKFDASKIDLENFFYDDIKSAIKMVQRRLDNTSLEKFIDSIKDSKDSDKWIVNQLLDDSILGDLGDKYKSDLKRSFNDMSPIQKEFYIKDFLSELRDKYKKMEEQAVEDGDFFDHEKIGYIIYNKMMATMDTYKSI